MTTLRENLARKKFQETTLTFLRNFRKLNTTNRKEVVDDIKIFILKFIENNFEIFIFLSVK